MPVPIDIASLSTTPGLNSPAGSESPATMDDYLRTHAAFIKQVSDASVALTGNQTIAGTKTFSSPIAGSVTGSAATATTAGNVTGTVAIANGGTGQITAAAAFTALKQAATDAASGVVELATDAEAQAGLDTARAITPANLKAAQVVLSAAVTLTTQTSVDFTGIPTWAKRVTVLFSGVSTNGTASYLIQSGAGAIQTTGYASSSSSLTATAVSTATNAAGILINQSAANNVFHGAVVLSKVTGNVWAVMGALATSANTASFVVASGFTLAGLLDRIRLTTTTSTDQFDAGSVAISWE